jgi:mono/diheme cytochrome c family protein
VLSKSDEQLLRSIKVGRSGTIGVMPKWMGVLDKQDREDVLAYIRVSFTPAPSSGASGEAPEGTSPEGP